MGLIEQSKQEYQASEWRQFGKTIGQVVAKFVPEGDESMPEPDTESTDPLLPPEGLEKAGIIADSFLSGFFGTVAPDVQPFVSGVDDAVKHFFAAAAFFKTKGLVPTGKALEELALGLEAI